MIGSAAEDATRFGQLTGAVHPRPDLFRRWSSADCGDLSLVLDWRSYLNSGYPDDRNDGALWEGRGLSSALTAGARARWKYLSAGFMPVIAWQQNREFPRPQMTEAGYSPYANPYNYGQIDLPLRFGPNAFWTVDPGQSFVRVDVSNVALGFSTENLWWGPGTRNALLMTNSGPGIPHFFLGTSAPQDIWIGNLEAQIVWGHPRQSDWFAADASHGRRLFTALTLGFEPSIIPGLYLGFVRAFLDRIPPGGLPLRDYFPRLFQAFHSGFNGAENQIASVFFRWVFPESGLEIYGEFGRDDYSANFKDIVEEPDHAGAYMFGGQKAFSAWGNRIRFVAEQAHTLTEPFNHPTRGVPIFFTHSDERQGYTNGGQMIGAGIGPQADSQFIALDLFRAWGRAGVWVERVQRNDRYFYDNYHDFLGHDAEIAAGLRGVVSLREFDLDWSTGYAQRYTPNFFADTNSWKLQAGITWSPGRNAPLSVLPH